MSDTEPTTEPSSEPEVPAEELASDGDQVVEGLTEVTPEAPNES